MVVSSSGLYYMARMILRICSCPASRPKEGRDHEKKSYLKIDDSVNLLKAKQAVIKPQRVTGRHAVRAQQQMLVLAVGAEVHDVVVHAGNGGVLHEDAEPLGDGVGERLVGDLARKRAAHGN